jgi:hypothetical protein
MELLPTLQTCVGMLWYGHKSRERARAPFTGVVPDGWTILAPRDRKFLFSAIQSVTSQPPTTDGRFLVGRNWSNVPQLLARALKDRKLPDDKGPFGNGNNAVKLANNFLEIVKPTDLDTVKSLIIKCHRLDIEQAVAIVLRLLPDHAAELVPLVPTIITQSCMWHDSTLPAGQDDTDGYRRKHLRCLLSYAGVEDSGLAWEDLAAILFRIRRKRPIDASRGLRLPEWIQGYCNGATEISWGNFEYPNLVIDNPIIVSTKNFNRITRYIWRLLPTAPEKVLRRQIQGLSRKLIFGDDARDAISQTQDRKSLAYTFLALQRKLQLKIVSDLCGRFLGKGEMSRFQQNTPHLQTSFEERLAEIAMAGETVDWAVLTAVRKPKGAEKIDSVDELFVLVDRVCECFERYVVIHGDGHTEKLRPQQGRCGGFRGPVDDWNAAVDILSELRRQIIDAGYQVVSNEDSMVDDFTVIADITEEATAKGMDLPKADKFLALDIMSWNNSWGDDVFGLKKMPPQWWTWLQKRRSEGKCPLPLTNIMID